VLENTLVVVLGGGVTAEGGVPQHTLLRVQKAFGLYEVLGDRAMFVTLSGGTTHKPPPVDSRGFPVWEATAAARLLISMGVPAAQVMEECFSLDTLGNVSIICIDNILYTVYCRL
jgi:uncharacterized SAM-binding protein YcdF (DUF218 family)